MQIGPCSEARGGGRLDHTAFPPVCPGFQEEGDTCQIQIQMQISCSTISFSYPADEPTQQLATFGTLPLGLGVHLLLNLVME